MAIDDAFTTAEDTSVSGDVLLANPTTVDSDVEGDTLTVSLVDDVDSGTLDLNPNGTFTYTPDSDFNGSDSFTYQIIDGNGGVDTATVTLTVTPVNDAPVANDDSSSTAEDTAVTINVTGNDTDIDGTLDLTSIVTVGPANGSLLDNGDGTITYTPALGFSGSDSFTYTITDNEGLVSNSATVSITIGDVNDAPVATDDIATTLEDTAATIDLTVNDMDSDGTIDATTLAIVTVPANGSLVNNGDGTVLYTPDADFNGSDTFTYTVADDDGTISNVATVTVTVTPVNDAPVALADSFSGVEDTPLSGDVSTNDSDVEGDTLTYTLDTPPATIDGALVFNDNGTFTFTPAANFNGTTSFTYDVSDGTDIATATVTLTIGSINDAPVAIDDTFTTAEDTSVSGDVLLANPTTADSDVEGDTLTVSLVDDVDSGTLDLNPNGTFTYTPDSDFNGSDSFTYQIIDGNGGVDTATVTLTVTPVNDAPVANDDSSSTAEDTAVTINVTGNDTDIDGTLDLTSIVTVGPANGSLLDNGDGTITYTPALGFSGSDSFTYTITDNEGLVSNSATVSITIGDVNDAPVATDDIATTLEDTAATIDLTVNDMDSDGTIDATTLAIVTVPANGSLVNNGDGTVLYTPDADFNGSDTFTYTVADDDGTISNVATVTVTVTPVNDAPVALADVSTVGEDDTTATTIDVLANDTDVDGGTLSINTVDVTGTLGTVINNGTTVSYDPAGAFESLAAGETATDTFSYVVSDDNGGTSTATVTVTIIGANDSPVAVDDEVMTTEDVPVSGNVSTNDNDADTTDALVYSLGDSPANGSVSLAANGTFTYTPAANFEGPTDTFTYSVSDGNGGVDTASVTVNITPVNDAPVANDDSVNTNEDTAVTINVAGNDTDVDDTLLAVSFEPTDTAPSNGAVLLVAGSVEYTPDPDFFGNDSFTYTVTDAGGLTSSATVNITVTPVSDAPVANDDNYSTAEDTQLSVSAIGVLVNDMFEVGGLTAILQTGAINGTVSLLGDGSFVYTPNENFNGDDSFTYSVIDGAGNTDSAVVTINVAAANDAPTIDDESFTIPEDTATGVLVGTVVGTDVDGPEETLTYSITAGNNDGLFTIDSLTGDITVSGQLNFEAQPFHELTVQVSDQGLLTDIATVTVNVTDVEEAGPTITALHVNSTAWTELFRDFIDFDESVDPASDPFARYRFNDDQALGYELPVGSEQAVTLPWINLNQIIVTFDQAVVGFDADDVTINGVAGIRPDATTATIPSVLNAEYIEVDADTFLGVITLNQSIEASRLTIGIDASGITDVDGNSLDGEWINGTSEFPSGDSISGGDFSFAVNVLPGDFDKSTGEQVDITDEDEIENLDSLVLIDSGTVQAAVRGYTPFADINGSGTIDNADIIAASDRAGSSLPAQTSSAGQFNFAQINSVEQSVDEEENEFSASPNVSVLESSLELASAQIDSEFATRDLDQISETSIGPDSPNDPSSIDSVFSEFEIDF